MCPEHIGDSDHPEGPADSAQGPVLEQLRQVQGETLELLTEMDHITNQVLPHLKADYAVKIGVYETELLKARLRALRAKRKLALITAAANRGESVDEQDLESALDQELEDWSLKVQASVRDLESMMNRRIGLMPMTAVDSRELTRVHRLLVKRFHPDLHPMDRRRAELFEVMQSLYEQGDLPGLTALERSTRDLEDADRPLIEDEAAVELELALSQLDQTREAYQRLCEEFPYSIRFQLEDPAWVCSQVQNLEEQIAHEEQVAQEYEARVEGSR